MKKTFKILASLTIGLISTIGFAQHDCHSKFTHLSPEVLLEKLDAKLHLNKTQEKRVLTLLENRLEQRQELKVKRKSLHHEEKFKMEGEIKSILNKDQLIKFENFKEKRTKEFKDKNCKPGACDNKGSENTHSKRRPEHRLEKLSIALDLTKDQQETIRSMFKEKHSEFKKNNPEFMQEKKQIKAGFERDMKTILTPEQFKTFKALKEDHKMKRRPLHK